MLIFALFRPQHAVDTELLLASKTVHAVFKSSSGFDFGLFFIGGI